MYTTQFLTYVELFKSFKLDAVLPHESKLYEIRFDTNNVINILCII